MRPLFAHVPLPGHGVLTSVGRKTGRERRHCVRAIRRGANVYLVAIPGPHTAWLWNIRADARVRLRLRRVDLEGVARELNDANERDVARDAYVQTVNADDYPECALHWRGRPTRRKIQRLHAMWFDHGVPVVIDLD